MLVSEVRKVTLKPRRLTRSLFSSKEETVPQSSTVDGHRLQPSLVKPEMEAFPSTSMNEPVDAPSRPASGSERKFQPSASLTGAMELMSQSRWEEAAQTFRRVLAIMDEPHIWVQYGHALKEAGFFAAANEAYGRGRDPSGDDFDLPLQIGHLHKIAGNFTEACRCYSDALTMCAEENTQSAIRDFLSSLESLKRDEAAEDAGSPSLIFSCVTGAVQHHKLASRPALGYSNYSYGFGMRGFQRAADLLSLDWKFVRAPHYISDLRQITTATRPVHLAFYPPRLARLLKGAYNILWFAWEFPAIPRDVPQAHAFSDPRKMLDLFDEIWLPSSSSVEIVQSYTSRPVKFVPSPVIPAQPLKSGAPKKVDLAKRLSDVHWVPLSIFPRLQSNFNNHALSRQVRTPELFSRVRFGEISDIYLSVFNPHDQRKQLKPMIDGFIKFLDKEKNALLLLKTSSPDDDNRSINQRLLTHQIARAHLLLPPYVSDRIWITNTTLSDEELSSLFKIADFYVCTSYAEGQNLPLLEAMLHGAVPVSVRHTAMTDYITSDNAIIIPHSVEPAAPLLEETYRIWGTNTQVVSDDDVCDALFRASQLSKALRTERTNKCKSLVSNMYSVECLKLNLPEFTMIEAGNAGQQL